ncbi:hypothetical protein NKH18_50520 [Streptomyces sp. M10(2022)]
MTSAQLAERDWWQGPELYVVADDYDLAGGGMGRGPLAALAEFIPQAAELGFHLVLARRVGGAARSLMSDPLLSKLKEIGSGGLLLSGDHREGALIGDQRARRNQPGRGTLVRRGNDPVLVQIALDDEDTGTAPHGTDAPSDSAGSRSRPAPRLTRTTTDTAVRSGRATPTWQTRNPYSATSRSTRSTHWETRGSSSVTICTSVVSPSRATSTAST